MGLVDTKTPPLVKVRFTPLEKVISGSRHPVVPDIRSHVLAHTEDTGVNADLLRVLRLTVRNSDVEVVLYLDELRMVSF